MPRSSNFHCGSNRLCLAPPDTAAPDRLTPPPSATLKVTRVSLKSTPKLTFKEQNDWNKIQKKKSVTSIVFAIPPFRLLVFSFVSAYRLAIDGSSVTGGGARDAGGRKTKQLGNCAGKQHWLGACRREAEGEGLAVLEHLEKRGIGKKKEKKKKKKVGT